MKTQIVLGTIVSILTLGISPVFAQDFSYDDYYNWVDRNPFWEAHSEDCPFHNGINWNTGEEMGFAGILPPQFSNLEVLIDTDLNGEGSEDPDRRNLCWTSESQGLEYFELSTEEAAFLFRAYSTRRKIYLNVMEGRFAKHFGFPALYADPGETTCSFRPDAYRELSEIRPELANHFIDVAVDYNYDHIGDIDIVQISSDEVYMLLPLGVIPGPCWLSIESEKIPKILHCQLPILILLALWN